MREADLTLTFWLRCWAAPIICDSIDRGASDVRYLVTLVLALLTACFPSVATAAALAAGYVAIGFLSPLRHGMVHHYVAGALHVALLLSIVAVLLRHRRVASAAELLVLLRWPARLIAAAVFFAGFAKLNRDFLDPHISCGGVYYLWVREWPGLSLLPDTYEAKRVAIYGAVAAEMGGPLLLWMRRTRPLGLGLIWLLALGLCSNTRAVYFEFIGLFWACSLFWLDPAVLDGAAERARTLGQRLLAFAPRKLVGSERALAALKVLCAVALAVAVVLGRGRHDAQPLIWIWLVAGLAVIALVAALVIASARTTGRAPAVAMLGSADAAGTWRVLALLPAIGVMLNEASVYAGWPHSPALKMASNFMAAGDRTNHFALAEIPQLTLDAESGFGIRPPYRMSTIRYYCDKAEPGLSRKQTLAAMRERLGEDAPKKKRPRRRPGSPRK